jgi:Ca-activated chloride channel homolog
VWALTRGAGGHFPPLVAVAVGMHFEGMRPVTFTNPEFLWLAPLALFVAWWWARRGRPSVRYSDASLFGGPRGGRAWRAVWGGAALRGLACLALVLGCAGPRRPDERTRIPAEGVAIMMVVDVSNSMSDPVPWAAGGPPVSRLEAARRAFKLFVFGGDAPDGTKFEPRPSDQIGLVAFAAIPEPVCPLTLNHSSVLLKELDRLEPKYGVDAGTSIGDAIIEATAHLDATRGAKRKLLILLSDGQHTQSKDDSEKPRAAAQLAANLKFPIYTIDAGGDLPPTSPPEVLAEREAGRQTLRDVAAMTGGRAFTAADGAAMLTAYKEIDAMEKAPVESYQFRRYFEFYPWCAAAAAAFLLIVHLLERTLWRVVP